MKTLLTALRQDLRTLRWILLPWLGMQVWWIFGSLPRFHATPVELERVYSVYVVMFHLGWAAILTLLAFTHPPCDPQAEWRTRPLNRWIVGAEKVGVGLFVLVIFPTLFYLASDPFRDSLISPYFFPKWLVVCSNYTVAFVFLFLVASFTRNIRQFFGIVVVIFVLGTLGLVNPATEGTVIMLKNYFGVTAIGLSIALAITGSAALIVAQFQRPRLALNLVRAATLLILIVTILPTVFPNYQTPPPSLRVKNETAHVTATSIQQLTRKVPDRRSQSDETKSKSPVRDPLDSTGTRQVRWKEVTLHEIQLGITFENLDPRHVWLFSDTRSEPHFPLWLYPEYLNQNDALLDQLGVPGYQIESGWSPEIVIPYRPRGRPWIDDGQNPASPTISYPNRANLIAVKLREIADIPLQQTMEFTDSTGLKIEVTPTPFPTQSRIIAVRVSMPPPRIRDFVLNWGSHQNQLVSRNRVERVPLLLVVDPQNKRATVLTHPDISETEWSTLTTRHHSNNLERLPDWEVPLESLRLKVFEIHYLGTLSLELEPPATANP